MPLLPINIQQLQFIQIISKHKNYLVKLLDTKTNKIIKFKYIHIQYPQDASIYLYFLDNLALMEHRNKLNRCLNRALVFQLMKKQDSNDSFIFIKEDFKNEITLLKYFNFQLRNNKHNRININKILLINLFDLFFAYNIINHLIIYSQNIFISAEGDLSANNISFIGVQLLIFGRTIKKQEFKMIYPYLDSNIMARIPKQRINYKQRQKNLGALILQLIMDAPLKLLQLEQLPENIDKQIAEKLLQKSKEKYAKLLKANAIKHKISKYSQQLNLNLSQLLYNLLVNEKQMKWSQVKDLLCPSFHNHSKEKAFIQQISKNCWWGLTQYEQKQLKISNIIETKEDLATNCELFMIYRLNLDIKSLKNGSLIDELANYRQFNLKKQNIAAQSIEYIFQNKDRQLKQSRQFDNYHQQQKQRSANQDGVDYNKSCLDRYNDPQYEQQQKKFIFKTYEEIRSLTINSYQSKQSQIERNSIIQQQEDEMINKQQAIINSSSLYFQQSNQLPLQGLQGSAKENTLQMMIEFYQRQFTVDMKYKQKEIQIVHDRAKCLKLYKQLLDQ